ncbi:2-phosphosulfolactate phosphatase [Evansella clarkii]|uniref:2-phosphosulfolactate phosphatase n=1 Tax=Evansella clarkii TaxID=79879 RepID=UPI000996DB8C|nr:2-phosphosulfolactate phosphatase [Evansella clarkii]
MFDQMPYDCKFEWGRRGAKEAAKRGEIIIIVDVLSFSSTVVTAVNFGAVIYPFPPEEDGKAYAEKVGAELILGRAEAAKAGKPTLSPVTFNKEHAGGKFVLTSLNGAFCTWVASDVPALLIGSLLNASSVAEAANRLRKELKKPVTVVACGERWAEVKEDEDALRPSVEDYLGAGAVLAKMEGGKSPEAEVCAAAFNSSADRLSELLWECGSGRELRERGHGADVEHCSQLDVYKIVPVLENGIFTANFYS